MFFVTPGYTVDSIKTMSPFLRIFDKSLQAFESFFKSGFLFFDIGVGIHKIKKLLFLQSFIFDVKELLTFLFNKISFTSLLRSIFFFKNSILS